jgi:hypothetical protein
MLGTVHDLSIRTRSHIRLVNFLGGGLTEQTDFFFRIHKQAAVKFDYALNEMRTIFKKLIGLILLIDLFSLIEFNPSRPMSHDFNILTCAGFLLRFWTMWWLNIPALRCNVLPPFSVWMQSTNTRCKNPKDQQLINNHRENLKTYI